MSFLTIFRQLLGALPPDPHQGSAPGHRWGTTVPQISWFPLAKIPAGARGGPTFFSEQGPGLSKSGPGCFISSRPDTSLHYHTIPYHAFEAIASRRVPVSLSPEITVPVHRRMARLSCLGGWLHTEMVYPPIKY